MAQNLMIAPDSSPAADEKLFAFSTNELGTLHSGNLKNPAAFLRLGGVDGLVKGLRSDRTQGLGGQATPLHSDVREPGRRLSRVFTSTSKKGAGRDEDEPYDAALLDQRKAVFLNNHLPTKKQPSFLDRLWMAYNDPVLFLLTAAAAVSLAIGLYQTFTTKHTVANPPVEWVEGVAIIVAIVIIVLVSSVNDWEKSRQFKKLNEKQLERDAKVIRYSVPTLISSAEVLVGDVVYLEPGDVVPADGILINGYNVTCDESSATGESELVHKTPGDDVFRTLKEQENPEQLTVDSHPGLDPFILSGTKVLEGAGSFLVTATGLNSTYGKVLSQLRDDAAPTPLQSRLAVLAKTIAWMGTVVSLLLFVALLIRFLASLPHDHRPPTEKGKNFVDIVIISLTVLVIAVPEGLPLAVTLSLAFATTRMLKDHNLVRELKACETMGNATSVCSDKTGTLTQNQMTVVAGMIGPSYHFYDKLGASATDLLSFRTYHQDEISSPADFVNSLHKDVRIVLRQSIALNTTGFESKDGSSFVGSNTESALLRFAKDHLRMGPVRKERSEGNIVQLIPFSGARKCMATVVEMREIPGTYRVFIKGAAEDLLSQCTRIVQDPTTSSLDKEMSSTDRDQVVEAIKKCASQALRMIGLVYRDIKLPIEKSREKTNFTLDYLLQDLVFLGIVGIQDPLRPGVWQSVKDCRRAGVTVRMVTGDNILTAKAIAEQCGILSQDASDIVMEGSEFRALSELEARKVVPSLKVLARSIPEDKQRLVVLLKEMGEIVAVTGDGTNDAPAMSAADVSFAMGITGTEVARQASSIIMLTDDFTCIVRAIMWGRAVNDSVKKFLQFQITITVTSVLLAFVSSISNSDEESVLTPVQLMWINLFQDTLAALALATDPPNNRLLDRKPEPRLAPLITVQMWKTIIGQSIYQTAVTLVLYFAGPRIFSYHTEHQIQQVNTVVFNAYVWMQIWNMYNSRQYDDTFNVFEGVFRNWLFMSVSSIMIGLQILIVFVGGQAFSVTPLTGPQWAVSLILGLLTLPIGTLIRCIPNGPLQKAIRFFKKRPRARQNSGVLES